MSTRKANLFISGAMKAGTTSFTEVIGQHPAIYISPIKEPNFFLDALPEKIYSPSRFFSLEKYFEKKFPQPLHIARIQNRFQYDKLFSDALINHKYLVDSSTAYLHAPESAEKIFAYNPDSKIIILTRDGLKRAFSHYKMDLGLGRTIKSFEAVLKQDWAAYKEGELSNWSYLGMSLYAENVSRYKKIFKENVLIIPFEDLVNSEQEILRKVFSFLGLDYMSLKLYHANESFTTHFVRPLSWLYKTGTKDFLSYLLPVKIRHGVFNLLKRESSLDNKLPEEFKNELLYLFREDLNKLEKEC